MKRQLAGYPTQPSGILELQEQVQKEWNDIPPQVRQKLIETMARSVAAVPKAEGVHTKY